MKVNSIIILIAATLISVATSQTDNKCELLIIYYKDSSCRIPRLSNPYIRRSYEENVCVDWNPDRKEKRDQWIIVTQCTTIYTFYRCFDQWTPNLNGDKAESASGTCHKKDDGSSYKVWLNYDALYITWGFMIFLGSIFVLIVVWIILCVIKRWNR